MQWRSRRASAMRHALGGCVAGLMIGWSGWFIVTERGHFPSVTASMMSWLISCATICAICAAVCGSANWNEPPASIAIGAIGGCVIGLIIGLAWASMVFASVETRLVNIGVNKNLFNRPKVHLLNMRMYSAIGCVYFGATGACTGAIAGWCFPSRVHHKRWLIAGLAVSLLVILFAVEFAQRAIDSQAERDFERIRNAVLSKLENARSPTFSPDQ